MIQFDESQWRVAYVIAVSSGVVAVSVVAVSVVAGGGGSGGVIAIAVAGGVVVIRSCSYSGCCCCRCTANANIWWRLLSQLFCTWRCCHCCLRCYGRAGRLSTTWPLMSCVSAEVGLLLQAIHFFKCACVCWLSNGKHVKDDGSGMQWHQELLLPMLMQPNYHRQSQSKLNS